MPKSQSTGESSKNYAAALRRHIGCGSSSRKSTPNGWLRPIVKVQVPKKPKYKALFAGVLSRMGIRMVGIEHGRVRDGCRHMELDCN
jgi:hypothetical protein